ncbi:MAG: hypothetical protein JJU13_10330 [Balneolaceae bacterium]|nr:hypothetical protein [Balneolaceae bacterium]
MTTEENTPEVQKAKNRAAIIEMENAIQMIGEILKPVADKIGLDELDDLCFESDRFRRMIYQDEHLKLIHRLYDYCTPYHKQRFGNLYAVVNTMGDNELNSFAEFIDRVERVFELVEGKRESRQVELQEKIKYSREYMEEVKSRIFEELLLRCVQYRSELEPDHDS